VQQSRRNNLPVVLETSLNSVALPHLPSPSFSNKQLVETLVLPLLFLRPRRYPPPVSVSLLRSHVFLRAFSPLSFSSTISQRSGKEQRVSREVDLSRAQTGGEGRAEIGDERRLRRKQSKMRNR
jgi:hypothetical protein